MATFLFLLSILGLVKNVLLAVLAVLNGILALFATIAIWKSYLIGTAKVALISMVMIPIFGVIAYFVWVKKKVDNA
jgi:uncharacterized membrane protein YagU involved in acid resistance